MKRLDTGFATITPVAQVVAGEYCTLHYVYTCGHPIDDSGYIKLVFRYAGDFGTPQFHDPTGANYCRIQTAGDCHIEPRWDPKGHVRPWGKALYLQVRDGFLNAGQTVEVVFGDRSEGAPGWRVQTFCENSFEFRTLVDVYATYQFLAVPDSPTIEIRPGNAVRPLCIAPSTVRVGHPFAYHVKREDRCGNPVAPPEEVVHPGFEELGTARVVHHDDVLEVDVVSNPIHVQTTIQGGRFWADFHAQSEETIGTNSIDDYFRFARDYARLDIVGHQGNDFQITDKFWERINAVCDEFNQEGSFVAFPGYEWSGNTPLGGDRNVFFTKTGCPIYRSSRALIDDSEPSSDDAPDALVLFACLSHLSGNAFVFAHVGGRYADLAMHDSDLELAAEVHSAWGTFEWLLEDAFRLGHRIGICANSDGHKGRPGASYPGDSLFGSYGGLTCVLADRLSRDSIYRSLKGRRFYATTGARINLDVTVDQGTGVRLRMGEERKRETSTVTVHVHVAGTAPIHSVEIRNGAQTCRTVYPVAEEATSRRLWILWHGAQCRGRGRVVDWDGRLEVTHNRIERFKPINFWSMRHGIEHPTPTQLRWTSATTGGLAGILLHVESHEKGDLEIQTNQGNIMSPISSLGRHPTRQAFDGLDKGILVQRLPAEPGPMDVDVEVAVDGLHDGDNPIYVRILQEDGHMAWSSPVYLV